MHPGMTIVNNQLDEQFFSCMFISILYMFRVAMCPSSGELLYQCDIWFMSLCVDDRLVCRSICSCIPCASRWLFTWIKRKSNMAPPSCPKKNPRGKREFPQLNINQNKKVITVKKKPLFSCSETHTVEFASRQRHYWRNAQQYGRVLQNRR